MINNYKKLIHYSDSIPMISTKVNRLIPKSISLVDSKSSGIASFWGTKKYIFFLKKDAKILVIDNKNFFNFGKEYDTPLNRGKEIYKYAKSKLYDGVLIKNEVHGMGDEYAIFDMSLLKTKEELENKAFLENLCIL